MPLSSSSQTMSPAVDASLPAPEAVGARDVDDAEPADAAGRSGTIRPDVAAPATSATRELCLRKPSLVSGADLPESGCGGGGGRRRRADGGAVVRVSDESSVCSAWEGMPRTGSRGALASKDSRIAVVGTFGPRCKDWPPSALLPRREGNSFVVVPAEIEEALPKYRPVKASQRHSEEEGACDTHEERRKEGRVLAAAAINATAAESLLIMPPAVAAQATFCRLLPRRQHNTTAVAVAQLLAPLARCLTRRWR